MNVYCTGCPAKYALPDSKLRGKKVKIRCKHCGTGIIVDGTRLPPETEVTAVEVTPQLDEAQERVLAATKERERLETERIANELKISQLENALSKLSGESRAHKELSDQLAREKAELEQRQLAEQAAREHETDLSEKQEAIEEQLAQTQQYRSETQRWREAAEKHLYQIQANWRIPLLDEDSQKARRNLVVLSGLAGFANFLHIVPTKMDILGVEFGSVQRTKWHLAVGLVLIYSLAAFSLKFWHSYRMWSEDIRKGERRMDKFFRETVPEFLRNDDAIVECRISEPRSMRRALLAEVALPLALAVTASVAAFWQFAMQAKYEPTDGATLGPAAQAPSNTSSGGSQ